MSKIFQGTYTALATPFVDGKIDWGSFEKLVQYQVDGGIDGFVVNGTTGESPTLRKEEVVDLLQRVKSLAPTQKVILGTGSNSTEASIDNVERANDLEIDGVLVVVPYYNKPPQRGLVAHFESIAEKSRSPVVMYNVPGRTIQSLGVESIGELSKHPNISGLKESTGDLEFLKKILEVVPKDFCLLSGDDGTAIDFCLNGGDGVIGVVTHLIPNQFSSWIRRAREKDPQVSVEMKSWMDLIEGIYVEANPIPVKAALQKMGIFQSAELRLPLVELDQKFQKGLKECLENHQLI